MKFLSILLLILVVSGCGGGASSLTAPSSTPTAVTGVTVTCAPTTVSVGSTSTCAATVTGNGTISQSVSWASTNGTITSTGVFTATLAGTATVTATSAQDATKSGSANVTITAPAPTVSSVVISCSPSTINIGATSVCTAAVSGANSPSQSVTWTSTGGSISTAGVFTAGTAGVSTITGTSTVDPTKSSSANVTVAAASSDVTGVTVTCSPSKISTAATSACSAVVAGTDSPSQAVTWSASSGAMASSGVLTPPAVTTKSQVTVTATSVADNTKTGTFVVTVDPQVPLNTPIFVGPGQLGGLTVNESDPLIAVNDVDVYSANDQTTATLHGEVTAMVGPDVLSLTQTNQVWLNGVLQTSVTTVLPPTLYQGLPVWFDPSGNVRTPQGILYAPTAGQDGIDLEGNGRLIVWVENVSDTDCNLYVSVSLASPQVIPTQGCVTWPGPVDANGNLYILYEDGTGLHDAVSVDNGASWTISTIPFSPEVLNFPSAVFPSMAVNPNGTLYAVWEQRGDPNTSDDVRQCWRSVNAGTGWATQADPLPPGGDAALGNFNPVVASDGSEALLSGEKFGVWLNSTQIVSSLTAGAPLLALLPDGTRVIAWGDSSGVWFEEVPN